MQACLEYKPSLEYMQACLEYKPSLEYMQAGIEIGGKSSGAHRAPKVPHSGARLEFWGPWNFRPEIQKNFERRLYSYCQTSLYWITSTHLVYNENLKVQLGVIKIAFWALFGWQNNSQHHKISLVSETKNLCKHCCCLAITLAFRERVLSKDKDTVTAIIRKMWGPLRAPEVRFLWGPARFLGAAGPGPLLISNPGFSRPVYS